MTERFKKMEMTAAMRSMMAAKQASTKRMYHDEPTDMTFSRRIALKLSTLGCYNPSNKAPNDEEVVKDANAVPKLDLAWEYFEHHVLPRCLVKDESTDMSVAKSSSSSSSSDSGLGKFDRAEIGEYEKKTMLYPVWGTPVADMADFGIGVGLYFGTLRFLCCICFVAALLNVPNMLFYASDKYAGAEVTEKSSIVDWGLVGSAVCVNARWVACPTCTDEDFDGDTWETFPGTEDRHATLFADDGTLLHFIRKNSCDQDASIMHYVLALVTLAFMILATFYWIYSQKKRIASYDNAEMSSTDYSIEIKNPPNLESSFSPDVWKKWFEEKFNVEVIACTVALDNEDLIKALVKRRSLILKLQNMLDDPETFDIDHIEDAVAELGPTPAWKKRFCFATCPEDLHIAIQKQHEKVLLLSEREYNVSSIFVTFQSERQQMKVLDALTVPKLRTGQLDEKYKYKDTVLNVVQPAEPNAIRWGDLNVGIFKKVVQLFFTTTVSFALIIGGGFVISYARSVSPSLAAYTITVLNIITPRFVRYLTSFESHPNESSYSASQYLKSTVFRWVNTTLVYTVITPFTDTIRNGEFLIKSVLTMFLFDLLLTPTLQLTDIFGSLQKHYFAPRAKSQRKMNLCFKAPTYDIGERTTNVSRILFFTFYYSAIFPGGFFFASAIFFMLYWLDKFSVLRTWSQGPKIGTQITKMSNIFYLLTLAAFAIMTFYNHAMFPFDNACLADDDEAVSAYIGNWTVGGEDVEVTANSQVYGYCNQNILRKFSLPLYELFEKEEKWIVDGTQQKFVIVFYWFMVCAVAFIVTYIVLRTFVKAFNNLFCKDFKVKVNEKSDLRFSDVLEINAYVPQQVVPGYIFPFLLCDVDEVDHTLIGWADPYSSYDSHNIIFDVPKILKAKMAQRKLDQNDAFASDMVQGQESMGVEVVSMDKSQSQDVFQIDDTATRETPIFSIVRSWDPVDPSSANKKYDDNSQALMSDSSSDSSSSSVGIA